MKRLVVALGVLIAIHGAAEAFCGFYVAGSGEKLFNDATQVVLMRQGTRTVLSMQNDYKGPPASFAMVIPVPVVLKEADVKTLDRAVFDKVEQMGAPRLVEYWEKDPCALPPEDEWVPAEFKSGVRYTSAQFGKSDSYGVTIEAQFAVGEYQIVILSAKDSTGLESWLLAEKYQIPNGAEPLLRPYVEGGSKFFVAKVDPKKVKFADGRAALSPLRFHYDSDDFSLPIRLGLANSSGKQDLIVNILAPNQRYEVANYGNVTIPTNIDVKPSAKDRFAELYAALFDATVEKHPGAVVTEYAWDASGCDPCPGPTLDSSDFTILGADVLGGTRARPAPYPSGDFVLTRLHARYGSELKDDLRFKAAAPIVGGREHWTANGKLEEGARPAPINNFQGRYAIRYAWTGPIRCDKPHRGVWGGPTGHRVTQPPTPATKLAFARRGAMALPAVVAEDVPELGIQLAAAAVGPPAASPSGATPSAPPAEKKKSGCGCQTSDSGGLVLGLGLALWLQRRPRRPRSR